MTQSPLKCIELQLWNKSFRNVDMIASNAKWVVIHSVSLHTGGIYYLFVNLLKLPKVKTLEVVTDWKISESLFTNHQL